jgi:sulfate transport system permease protein
VADLAIAAVPATAPDPPKTARPGPVGAGTWVLRAVVIVWVGILVLVPVAILVYRALSPGWTAFTAAIEEPEAQHAFQVTLVITVAAVVIDVVFGVAAAILLVRYRFPGRRLLNALIDRPVAVSPIVVGLALILVYGPNGWFGSVNNNAFQIIGAKPGMVAATVFVSLPMVVRAVAPVLEQAGTDQDQAAASLGANAVTRFWRITMPTIRVALGYGTVLSIARCLGEYGAVLVVSQNIEDVTETVPLRIDNLVTTESDYDSAYALALVLMLIAIAAILIAALLRRRGRKTT